MSRTRLRAGRWGAAGQEVFALFGVAAGPRLGHGHLRRAEALADAMGRSASVCVRGAGAPTRLPAITARTPAEALDDVQPAVLVLDEPTRAHALAWCRAARTRRVPVVSLHDLGLARVPSTVAIDGSVASPQHGWPSTSVLRGLRHAVIGPPHRNRRSSDVRRVLVSLGGGPRRTMVLALAKEIARRWPALEILVPLPMDASPLTHPRVRSIGAPAGLGPWFTKVDVAIVAGGVSLYEAIAAGVPPIALAVVPEQRPTIHGFAALGLACDGGRAGVTGPEGTARRIADHLARVMNDAVWRGHVRREGPRVVDGRGAVRAARAIIAVAEARRA